MAQLVRISCINKPNRNNPYERIQNVGGVNPDGTRWRLTLDEAIVGIDAGRWEFYVDVDGDRVPVIVVRPLVSPPFLKTVADGDLPNNLLRLPECP